MAGFLLDENLPPQHADGLALLGFEVVAIGRGACPAKGASDDEVVRWCIANDCVLVTRDRGRKNREMINLIRGSTVSVLMLNTTMTLPQFVRQFVRRYDVMYMEFERVRRRGGAYRRRLSPTGRLEKL